MLLYGSSSICAVRSVIIKTLFAFKTDVDEAVAAFVVVLFKIPPPIGDGVVEAVTVTIVQFCD